jgi:glutamine synthetase
MDALSVFYNPHINSYKRLVPGWFAPVRADWGIDDRAAAIRVIAGSSPEQTHVEIRRPGADANPYLVLAAAAVSVVLGLQHRVVPPDPVSIDAPELPRDLRMALSAFISNDAVQELLGDAFSAQFQASREWELAAWSEVVTDWEIARSEGALSASASDDRRWNA